MRPSNLPQALGPYFTTQSARALGVSERRLRALDLEAPFRGVRICSTISSAGDEEEHDHYSRSIQRELSLLRALATRLLEGQFLSHRSAAIWWQAPVPFRSAEELHVSTFAPARAPQISGVHGHSLPKHRVKVVWHENAKVAAPASVFASLGSLPLEDLVALGDYFVRAYRPGYRRRDIGKRSLCSITELHEMVELGRWRGIARLRQALNLVREDSWSPRESMTRVCLVLAGLPEPELNVDLFDDEGFFLGCVDMVYRDYKVAIEYQGAMHARTYAADIERIEAMRAAGWEVIQVTSELLMKPGALVQRVSRCLESRGWQRS